MKTDYLEDAVNRLSVAGGRLKIELSDTKAPTWDHDGNFGHHYICTLTGPGGEYTFDFWGSIADRDNGEEANAYDVLACLGYNCPAEYADFCAEFGYDEDSRKARATWRACLRQARALARIFPDEAARQNLAEIS